MLFVLPTNRINIVNIEQATSGSSAWIPKLEHAVHRLTRKIRESAIGAMWLPPLPGAKLAADAHSLFIWGPTWLCTVRGGGQVTVESRQSQQQARPVNGLGSKRGHEANGAAAGEDSEEDASDEEHDEMVDGLQQLNHNGGGSKKSGKQNGSGNAATTTTTTGFQTKLTFAYQSILLADFIPAQEPGEQHEAVVVERPYFSLTSTLPPAYYRGVKYGS